MTLGTDARPKWHVIGVLAPCRWCCDDGNTTTYDRFFFSGKCFCLYLAIIYRLSASHHTGVPPTKLKLPVILACAALK